MVAITQDLERVKKIVNPTSSHQIDSHVLKCLWLFLILEMSQERIHPHIGLKEMV